MSEPTRAASAAAAALNVREAQDMLAATIPELEKIAWRFFAIGRDLEAPLDDETFADEVPGPEHLRYFTAAGAMAVYSEMLELIPYLRKTAEKNDGDLREEWQGRQAHDSLPAEERQRKAAAESSLQEEFATTRDLLRMVIILLKKDAEEQQKGAEP